MNPPDVVNRLASENQGLVVHLAKLHQGRVRKLCNARVRLADLIGAGKIGLVEAARRYDPAKGKFSTYAACWINKYLFKARHKRRSVSALSLNAPVGNRGDIFLEDTVADKKATGACDLLSDKASLEDFRRVIMNAGLDGREREVILQRYGLDNGELKTQRQIAKSMGLTRARIGQIEKTATGKLEARIRELL
jgi:RNA polymerase sporulation-specific sigma factor